MQYGRAVHHDDVRTSIYFRMRPSSQPAVRRQAFRHSFGKYRRERVVSKDMIVQICNHNIRVSFRLMYALQYASSVLLVRSIRRAVRQIDGRLILLTARLDPKFIYARAINGGM